MSKERLGKVEEIVNIITTTESEEEYNSAVNAFILSHMNWLIERVQELEKDIKEWEIVNESWEEINTQIVEQNKRYREALEFYAGKDNYQSQYDEYTGESLCEPVFWDEGENAREALEGEE